MLRVAIRATVGSDEARGQIHEILLLDLIRASPLVRRIREAPWIVRRILVVLISIQPGDIHLAFKERGPILQIALRQALRIRGDVVEIKLPRVRASNLESFIDPNTAFVDGNEWTQLTQRKAIRKAGLPLSLRLA